MNVLKQIAPTDRPPLMLDGLKFDELFIWLSKSVTRVSSGKPGTGMIDLPAVTWGKIPL
jgi:uncharacterized protein YegL